MEQNGTDEMAKVTITVCDECHDPSRSVTSYRITSDGRTAVKELCAEHGAFLEALFEQGTSSKPTSRRLPRRGTTRIATMDEIQRAKEAKRAE
jgi:hypothetical protein